MNIFNSKVIDDEFGDLNIIYYSNFIKKYINLFKYFLIIIARHIKFYVDYLLKSHKLNVMGVNCNENGLDLDDLEHKLKSGLKPKFLYTIPTFHNPTGTTMPSQNRERLVSLANKYNFYIVADEVYQFIYFNEPHALIKY